MKFWMFLKIPTFQKTPLIAFQDYGNQGEKLQNDETTTQHIGTCTILVDTEIYNKTPFLLLDVILDSIIFVTMIN